MVAVLVVPGDTGDEVIDREVFDGEGGLDAREAVFEELPPELSRSTYEGLTEHVLVFTGSLGQNEYLCREHPTD